MKCLLALSILLLLPARLLASDYATPLKEEVKPKHTKPVICPGTKMIGWAHKEDVTPRQMIDYNLAKEECKKRKGGRSPCLISLEWKPTKESYYNYHATCGQPRK